MNTQEVVRLKELDLELIQPNTSSYKDPGQGGSKICVVGKPGCFAKNTEVLMYSGDIKKVQDIKPGDKVMGPDSKERTVLQLCRGKDKMYKVTPNEGESYTVNLKHKLVLKNKDFFDEVKEVSVNDFLILSENERKKWRIFRTSVDFPDRKVEIEPYIFALGLTSDKKNLLTNYTVNSRENRLDFLAGIMDSYRVEYGDIKCHKQDIFLVDLPDYLVNAILYVCRSLGFLATKSKDENKIEIKGNLSLLRSHRYFLKSDHDYSSSDFTLEYAGKDDYYGFTIDGDHRFLLSTFDVVRNTGKTTLISSILYAKKHIFPVAQAYSGTEESNHFYQSVLPSTFVFNSYDEAQVEKFIKRQKIAKEHLENPWGILILDDCTDDPSVFRKPLQNGLYKRGRHWKMLYILSLQYGMDIRPNIRTNIDGTFLLREPNLRNRRVLYENYASIIPDFKMFCDILDQITDDFTALYIHNATRSNDWRDCVFWYKAKPVPKDFRIGCEEYWDFHNQRYNTEYVDPL